MKTYKAYGIAAIISILLFIVYQFLFTARRSRMKIDPNKINTVNVSFRQQAGFVKLHTTRMMVREGTLQLEVKNLEAAREAITRLTIEANGYVTSEDQEEYAPGYPRAHQIIRIPSNVLDEFIVKVEGVATKVESKKMSALDVTEESIDVESRLETKKKMEVRFMEIISRATTIDDVLEIEMRIGQVRSDIESLENRLNYLKNQSSFSTLNVVMYEPPRKIVSISFGQELTDSLKTGWHGLVEVVKALATIWPLLLTFTAVTWFVIRRRRKQLIIQ